MLPRHSYSATSPDMAVNASGVSDPHSARRTTGDPTGEPITRAKNSRRMQARDVIASAISLTDQERGVLVDQAISLVEGFYAHLPLKRAMYGIEPLQRLRVFRHRLATINSDDQFHSEMRDIFTSLRDRHTAYRLPSNLSEVYAKLPFRVEAYFEKNIRKYLIAGVENGFEQPEFEIGMEVLSWNGVPIHRAVEMAANRCPGGNTAARRANGVVSLTVRSLQMDWPPDEDWVIVGYRTLAGEQREIRIHWEVFGDVKSKAAVATTGSKQAEAFFAFDDQAESIRRLHQMLYAPKIQAFAQKVSEAKDPLALVQGTISTMPQQFNARIVETQRGTVGYIRIWSFMPSDHEEDGAEFARRFVLEFIRLSDLLPRNGLIIDVRSNGGGLIWAGEQLLQVLTPRRIEPARFQFINSPSNLLLCQSHSWLADWTPSVERAVETNATFSAAFPLTPAEWCNGLGQRYHGPVLLITDARSYSTTDIFAAGFQDHMIGKILGVDANTGAGGANVWEQAYLVKQFLNDDGSMVPGTGLEPLPGDMIMRVAIRRSLRVGAQAGTELEDFGVRPDEFHQMTRRDLLEGNSDLIEHAAALLAVQPAYTLDASLRRTTGLISVEVTTLNLERIDLLLDGRLCLSENVKNGTVKFNLPLPNPGPFLLDFQGYASNKIVAGRRIGI